MSELVLSLFPGLDLLGRAFSEAGWCVVLGPDVLWGRDVREFHAPSGCFSGIIGGPPCQIFSRLRHLNPLAGQKHGNLIPEFERVVAEAQPCWWLMENVPDAPSPEVAGYQVHRLVLNNRWLGEAQDRTRAFAFGTTDGRRLVVEVALFEAPEYRQAVTRAARAVPVKLGGSGKVKRTYTEAGQRATVADMLVAQGAEPSLLDESPFTTEGSRRLIGNAVPLPMGRAIATAVRRALEAAA